MRQGLFPICIVCAVTAASSRKNFDKPSIATEKSFCNSKGVCIRSKQCFVVPFWNTEAVLQAMSLYTQRPLPCKRLLGAAQTRCSASCRCRLHVFAKRSFSTPQERAASRKRDVHRGLGLHPNKQNTHGKVSMPCVFWPLCAQRHCLLELSALKISKTFSSELF